jgi:hypothetical protein
MMPETKQSGRQTVSRNIILILTTTAMLLPLFYSLLFGALNSLMRSLHMDILSVSHIAYLPRFSLTSVAKKRKGT